MEQLGNISISNTHWTNFRDRLYPKLHELSTAEVTTAMRNIDSFLFNNTMIFCTETFAILPVVSYKHADNAWKLSFPGLLGMTDLHHDGSITITICNENHNPCNAFTILETLVHEMCHAVVMRITGRDTDHHGRLWQTLALGVEKAMARLLRIPKVEMMRREGAMGDIGADGVECPHLTDEDIDRFFGNYPETEKEGVRCKCEVSEDVGSDK